MKIKLLKLKQFIKNCYSCVRKCFKIIFNKLKDADKYFGDSLIYNILKMFVIVFGILLVLFRLSPNTAHVSMTSKNIFDATLKDIKQFDLEVKITDSNPLIFQNIQDEDLIIKLEKSVEGGYIADGKYYDSSYSILLKSNSNIAMEKTKEDYNSIRILPNDDDETIDLIYTPYNIDVECQNGCMIYSSNNLKITPMEKERLFLIKEGEKDIPINSCVLNNNDESFILTCNTLARINIRTFDLNKKIVNDFLNVGHVKSVYCTISGDVYFSYSPTSKKYHLHRQTLELSSKNDPLDINIQLNQNPPELNINGMVNSASISGMNLFPTFIGWYRENVFLVPLTLITTVFGGVTLMTNHRKKEDKNN